MVIASDFDPEFEREHGCTEVEWQRWMPAAVRSHALEMTGPQAARVDIGSGFLHLSWSTLPPLQIAHISMPRLAMRYRFENVDAPARREFMRYFDLYMHRGGG